MLCALHMDESNVHSLTELCVFVCAVHCCWSAAVHHPSNVILLISNIIKPYGMDHFFHLFAWYGGAIPKGMNVILRILLKMLHWWPCHWPVCVLFGEMHRFCVIPPNKCDGWKLIYFYFYLYINTAYFIISIFFFILVFGSWIAWFLPSFGKCFFLFNFYCVI